MRIFSASVSTPYAQVEQHERAKNEGGGRVHVCIRAYASQRTRTRARNVKGRKAGRRKKKAREKKRERTRVHIHIRAPAPLRTRERRAAADFAFCSRCFLCVLLPLFFSTLSTLPPAPRPTYTSPFLTLDAPGKKKTLCFLPSFFLRYMPPSVIFEALFPEGLFTRRYLRCKSKRAPLPHFFMAQPLRRAGRLVIQKIGSLNSRLPCILTRLSENEVSPGEFIRRDL